MLNITDTRTGTQKTIYPYPNRVGSVGDAMIGHKYRFNWNSPIAVSPQNRRSCTSRQRSVQVERLRQLVAADLAGPHDETIPRNSRAPAVRSSSTTPPPSFIARC